MNIDEAKVYLVEVWNYTENKWELYAMYSAEIGTRRALQNFEHILVNHDGRYRITVPNNLQGLV